MSIPELVIPVRLDTGAAAKGLGTLGQAGTKAGADVAAGMKSGEQGARGLESGMLDLMKAQMGLAAIKATGAAIGSEFKRGADYTRKLAEDFIDLQKHMQSVASLANKKNTAEFTLSEAQGAGRANVTPQEYRNFRDAFLSKASTYIGSGKDAKMSEKDAREYQENLAEYAKQKGISQEEMANFGGGLLAQQKGPTNAKEMLAKAGKTFATLEASSAPVSHLLPGMTRVMAQGLSAEEAAPALAQMPEIAPEEESTHLLRLIAEMRRNNLEGKGADFGMKKGTSPKQQLDDLVKTLREQTGGDQDKLDARLKEFTHEDIAANTLRGLVNQGPQATDKWKKIVKDTPENEVENVIKAGRGTDIGRRYAAESRLAVGEATRGALAAPVETERLEGRADVTARGELEQGRASNLYRGTVGTFTGTDSENQIVNEATIRRMRNRAAELGIAGDSAGAFQSGKEGIATGDVMYRSQGSVNSEIKELAKLIDAAEKRKAARDARRDARADAPPVRVEPPPRSKR